MKKIIETIKNALCKAFAHVKSWKVTYLSAIMLIIAMYGFFKDLHAGAISFASQLSLAIYILAAMTLIFYDIYKHKSKDVKKD